MADLSQLELNGTTYDLKDATARGSIPAAATATPSMNTVGAVGTSTKYAKEDHTHPPIFGTCSTSGTSYAKVVTCPGFSDLTDGTIIYVYFTYGNSATNSLSLNVNATGAKSIRTPNNVTISSTNKNYYTWESNEIVGFVYHVVSGTGYWIMLSPPEFSSGTYSLSYPAKFNAHLQYLVETAYTTANAVKISNVIEVVLPNVSSSNRTFNVTGITADHQVIQEGFAYFSNPGAVGSDLTLITSAGQITINGTLTGVTDINVTMAIIPTAALGTAVT